MVERLSISSPQDSFDAAIKAKQAEDRAILEQAWIPENDSSILSAAGEDFARTQNALKEMEADDRQESHYQETLDQQPTFEAKFNQLSLAELAKAQADLERGDDKTTLNDLRELVIKPRLEKSARSMIDKGASEVVSLGAGGAENEPEDGDELGSNDISREDHLIMRFDKLVDKYRKELELDSKPDDPINSSGGETPQDKQSARSHNDTSPSTTEQSTVSTGTTYDFRFRPDLEPIIAEALKHNKNIWRKKNLTTNKATKSKEAKPSRMSRLARPLGRIATQSLQGLRGAFGGLNPNADMAAYLDKKRAELSDEDKDELDAKAKAIGERFDKQYGGAKSYREHVKNQKNKAKNARKAGQKLVQDEREAYADNAKFDLDKAKASEEALRNQLAEAGKAVKSAKENYEAESKEAKSSRKREINRTIGRLLLASIINIKSKGQLVYPKLKSKISSASKGNDTPMKVAGPIKHVYDSEGNEQLELW